MRKFGEKYFTEKIDITDPCYDKDTWCRINNYKVVPGTYNCNYTEIDAGNWGKRISLLEIFNKDYKKKNTHKQSIGYIGVDAGLAGFFNNKKDYDDKEWHEFCKQLKDPKVNVWGIENGFFSASGYGDGEYEVFAYQTAVGETVGLQIRFI